MKNKFDELMEILEENKQKVSKIVEELGYKVKSCRFAVDKTTNKNIDESTFVVWCEFLDRLDKHFVVFKYDSTDNSMNNRHYSTSHDSSLQTFYFMK